MIRLFKALYENKVSQLETENHRLDAANRIFQEVSQIVVDRPDKDGWVRLSQANDREKGMVQTNHLEMIRKAREFSRFDPNARAALTAHVHYIMGRGLTITPKSDDPEVWHVWREFWTSRRNRMSLKQFEIVHRSLRDGEIFIRFFTKDEAGKNTGKTTIRFLDPLLIRSNGSSATPNIETINNGVNTNPEDVEDVKSYTLQDRADSNKFTDIPAEEILHIKINVDSDQKRGESQLLAILQMLKHHEQWLENRIILNKMRSAIVLVRTVEGTASEVASIANSLPVASNPAGEQKRKNIRPGTILNASQGVKYEMLSPNLNAADAKEDGRNIKLNMAAGTNLPEYMFGDASNQNYASSLIAESPFVKAIQFWQIFYEVYFSEIYRQVIQNAVDAGVLKAPSDDEYLSKIRGIKNLGEAIPEGPEKDNADADEVEDGEESETPELKRKKAMAELMPNGKMESPSEVFFGCDMSWPEIIHRDLKAHVDALTIARQNGWVADPTACSALGYDYPEEVRKQRQVEEEAAEASNPLLGLGGEGGDSALMDAELEGMLDGLSPEDRDQVLKAKDPREVVRIMGRKKAAAAGAGEED